jgi:hypothetical protein
MLFFKQKRIIRKENKRKVKTFLNQKKEKYTMKKILFNYSLTQQTTQIEKNIFKISSFWIV